MKYIVATVLFVMFSALLVCAQTTKPRKFKHNGKIVTKYDKSRNLTTILLQAYTVKDSESGPSDYVNSVDMLAGFAYEGKEPTGSPAVIELALQITRTRRRSDKTTIPDLIAEIDGEELNLGKPRLIEEGNDNFKALNQRFNIFMEKIALLLPKDVFQKISSAKTVKLESGDVRIILRDKHLEALRDLASRIT